MESDKKNQIFGSSKLVAAMIKYQFDKSKPYPVAVDDVVIFDHNPEFFQVQFETWLDRYFEYIQYGPDTYRITGILTKNFGK